MSALRPAIRASRPATRGRRPARRLCAGPLRRLHATRSVILGYHGVGRAPRRQDLSQLVISPERFATQLELLLDAGFRFLTVAELARLAAGATPPPGYAAVSFDDGMRNNLTVALPILRARGVPATVYVTIGFLGGTSPWVGPRGDNAMLSEAEVRELAAAGWELGAHTMTHPDLDTLDYDACRREIEQSRTELERIGGVPVRTLAYPSGRYGPAAIAAARDSGLIAAVTTGLGGWGPYELHRAMIGAADPLPVFLLKLADRYEPMLRLPPLDLLRRASKRARGWVQERSEEEKGEAFS